MGKQVRKVFAWSGMVESHILTNMTIFRLCNHEKRYVEEHIFSNVDCESLFLKSSNLPVFIYRL